MEEEFKISLLSELIGVSASFFKKKNNKQNMFNDDITDP